jgi:hypothetical protein
MLIRQVHIPGGGLRGGVAHQLPQRQQVDARRRQLGAIGMAQAVRPHPERARALPVVAEHAAHPGLGERPALGRAVQHHEALRRGKPRRAFAGQVSGKLGEEHVIDGDDPLPAAFAHHAQLPAPLVNIGEQKPADLPGPQPAQQHGQHDRPVPVRPQAGQEHRHISRIERFRQPPFLADQPTAASHPARAQMPKQPS